MLISFTVENFRSFRDAHTLSLEKTPLKEQEEWLNDNEVQLADKGLLRAAAIYGANASGKSNIIEAISFAQTYILSSHKEQGTSRIPVKAFALQRGAEQRPSSFEFEFIPLVDGRRDAVYRYGFAVDKQRVCQEWLYRKKKRETMLFDRDEQDIKVTKTLGQQANELIKMTRKNALFLSVLGQFNHALAAALLLWFHQLVVRLNEDNLGSWGNMVELIQALSFNADDVKDEPEIPEAVLKPAVDALIKALDLAVVRIDTSVSDNIVDAIELLLGRFPQLDFEDPALVQKAKEEIKEEIKLKSVKLYHALYDEEGHRVGDVPFSLQQVSHGTKRLYYLAHTLILALWRGSALFLDEFDTSLHPHITRYIITMFNEPRTNPHGAQLIFTTHDTTVMDRALLRRDQLWFVEKDRFGASELYSLAEYKGVRNDQAYEPSYLAGRYGALPRLQTLDVLKYLQAPQDTMKD